MPWSFSVLANKFQGDSKKILAAYNAGPTRIANGKPLPKETKHYLACVNKWWKKYNKERGKIWHAY